MRGKNAPPVYKVDNSWLKPNSHQTIFSTDSHRRPPIQEAVGVGRFLKKKSVGVTWESVGSYTTDFSC